MRDYAGIAMPLVLAMGRSMCGRAQEGGAGGRGGGGVYSFVSRHRLFTIPLTTYPSRDGSAILPPNKRFTTNIWALFTFLPTGIACPTEEVIAHLIHFPFDVPGISYSDLVRRDIVERIKLCYVSPTHQVPSHYLLPCSIARTLPPTTNCT